MFRKKDKISTEQALMQIAKNLQDITVELKLLNDQIKEGIWVKMAK